MPEDVKKSGEQQTAEADVEGYKEELGPFVVAAETTRMPMMFTDAKAPGHPIIFVNQAFLDLTGYDEHEVMGQSFDFLMGQGTDPEELAEIQTAFRGGRELEPQVRYRCKKGGMIWVRLLISEVRDAAGAVVQHFASFVDITRHRTEEDRLRRLLDEVNHRTQDMLATVLAIAKQTLRGTADPAVTALFEGRILALSQGHALLGGTEWGAVGLRDVIERILQPFGLDDLAVPRFTIVGDDVRLQPRAALTLAMVFHELATNAAKHGALLADTGRIGIDWQVEPDRDGGISGGRLCLRWQESGGPPVVPPTRRGFGSRLIQRGLEQELDGEVHLEYEPGGVLCQIAMPVAGRQAETPRVAYR